MMIRMVRYPAGFLNKWHFHPCAHGMFVLEGTLLHPSRRAQGQMNLLFGGACKIDQRLNMEIDEWHPCRIRYFC